MLKLWIFRAVQRSYMTQMNMDMQELWKDGGTLQSSLHGEASLNIYLGRTYKAINTIILRIVWTLC